MNAAVVGHDSALDLLSLFERHHDALGGQPEWRRQRLAAARTFLEGSGDLVEWMARPVEARLLDLERHPLAWQVVSLAIAAGVVHADAEFLFAKNFGHSMTRWIEALFADDIERLRQAAQVVGATSPHAAVREILPLAVAFSGCRPWELDIDDLDSLGQAIESSPRLTAAMRRARRAQLFRLRRLLFEAAMIDLPAQR